MSDEGPHARDGTPAGINPGRGSTPPGGSLKLPLRADVAAELEHYRRRELELLTTILSGRASGPDRRGDLAKVRARIRELTP